MSYSLNPRQIMMNIIIIIIISISIGFSTMLTTPETSTDITVNYQLNESRCPHCIKYNSQIPCSIKTKQLKKEIVYGKRRNYTIHCPIVYCGDRKSKTWNLMKSINKFELSINTSNHITSSKPIIHIGHKAMITYTLYAYIQYLCIEKPGLHPGNMRKRIISEHCLQYREEEQDKNPFVLIDELKLKKQVTELVISKVYIRHIIQDIMIKVHLIAEQQMYMILLHEGNTALTYDWTFNTGKNCYDRWDCENKQDDAPTKELKINDSRRIDMAVFTLLQDTGFALLFTPTPNCSEEQEYFIPILARVIEDYLKYSKNIIKLILLKSDGFKKNACLPLKITNEMISNNQHGIINGYDLAVFIYKIFVCIYLYNHSLCI